MTKTQPNSIYKAIPVAWPQSQLNQAMSALQLPWSIWDRNSQGNLLRKGVHEKRVLVWRHMRDVLGLTVSEISRQTDVSHSCIFDALKETTNALR